MADIWSVLKLKPATLSEIDALDGVSSGEEERGAHSKISFPEAHTSRETAVATVLDWHRQEPVERIVNAILLCALRDGARGITVEPEPRIVRVRFKFHDTIRDHIQLPIFTLEPVALRLKLLARLDTASHEQSGTLTLQVDGTRHELQIQTSPTAWGQRIELEFASE